MTEGSSAEYTANLAFKIKHSRKGRDFVDEFTVVVRQVDQAVDPQWVLD